MQTKRVVLVLFVLASMLLAACEKTSHTVRYEVTGSASAMTVTYRNESGANVQTDAYEDWSMEFTSESYEMLYVRVRNQTASGDVTCRIFIDGEVFMEGTSTGAYKIATCSGMLPAMTPTPQPSE